MSNAATRIDGCFGELVHLLDGFPYALPPGDKKICRLDFGDLPENDLKL
jgi:hypothetical protein